MKKLYVLYDHRCGLCVRAAQWLRLEPAYVTLETMPAASQRALEMFPFLASADRAPVEVLAVSDEGGLYSGPAAWIMCLYALKRHRALALKLAQPRWMPLTKKVIQMLSNYRIGISRLMALAPERVEEAAKFAPGAQACGGACGVG